MGILKIINWSYSVYAGLLSELISFHQYSLSDLSLGISSGFGRCGAGPSADLVSSDDALDGILGFGKSNSSMISQLASSGRVKRMFAHCLDGVNGGGIFAIGNVVQPKVNTTPLISDQYVVPFPMSFYL